MRLVIVGQLSAFEKEPVPKSGRFRQATQVLFFLFFVFSGVTQQENKHYHVQPGRLCPHSHVSGVGFD